MKISEKNANVVCHAVLPPEYQAGGDSKREDLCWPDSERSNEHDARSIKLPASGGSSSGRPVATEDPSREKSPSSLQYRWRTIHQEVQRSCKHFQTAERGGALI